MLIRGIRRMLNALRYRKEEKDHEESIGLSEPSVDAIAEITNRRSTKIAFGIAYRGCCEIKKDYLTSFAIDTEDGRRVAYGQPSLCKVSFITPKVYPASLWKGRTLKMYEGNRTVGDMKIVEILNPSLSRNSIFESRNNILSDHSVLNAALKLSLEWGMEYLKSLDNKVMYAIPNLSGSDIEKVCSYVSEVRDDVLWKIYYDHYDREESKPTIDVEKETADKYPWIDKSNLAHLHSQGIYYAWHG
jgi:hypothetical protein